MSTFLNFALAAGGLLLLLVLMKKGGSSLNSPMSTLVLTRFSYQENDESKELVRISGRESGLMGWLLVKLGLGAETTMVVNKTELLMKSCSLSGEFHSNMSLKNIASSHCGFYKPIPFLILGIVFLLMGLSTLFVEVAAGFFMLLLGGGFLVLYYFKKMIRIMVQTKGGSVFGMCFTPSLIEGVNVDMKKAESVVALINKYMLLEQNR